MKVKRITFKINKSHSIKSILKYSDKQKILYLKRFLKDIDINDIINTNYKGI